VPALVIDTSSAAVTAGVVEGREVLAERVTVNARAHGELLAPSIRDCLDRAGIGMADLAAVIAGVGPGPFTGLRVGLVTAAAICDALAIPGYPVCSLDAIAAVHPDRARLLVAGDARRKEIYWALYANSRRLTEPDVAAYVESREGIGKAGGYAIQGRAEIFVKEISGSYSNVVGLPLSLTMLLLQGCGAPVP